MDGYTTGKAGGGVTQQLASIPTAYQNDALELARAQRLAEMLGSTETPQGQMISGRFVAPSWSQNLAKLAQTGLSAYYGDQAEKQNIALAKKIREGESTALADYMTQLKGRPASQQQTELAGPYGQGVGQAGANVPQPMATRDIPAVEANPFLANMNASMNDMLPSWMRQHAMKEVTKGPEWKEINQVNKQTGETEIWRYDANSPKPRDTLQFLGTSKAALTPHEVLTLNDSGVGTGRFGNPYGGTGGNVGGGTSVVPVGGGSVVNPAVSGGPSAKTPVSGKTDDLIKQFGYNPFEAPKPPPTLVGGAQVRKFYSEQAGPLPAEVQKTVKGAINYQKAVEDLQNEFAGYSDIDLAKPNVRARLQQKVTNAYLLGKDSNSLGALTGPDLDLLKKLVTDPTAFSSLILDRQTINSLYDAQRRSAGDNVRESYRQAQKPVPEDMRSTIIVTPKPLPMSQAEVRKAVTEKGIKYDPAYEYQINPDGTVDRRKKR
jgi:hypothetical protein